MEEKLLNIACDALAILIPVLAAFLIELMRRYIGTEKLRRVHKEFTAKQEIALLAVRVVEQYWSGTLHGEEKVDRAVNIMLLYAQRYGLKFKPHEFNDLIEQAVRRMKDEFGNEWAKVVRKGDGAGETSSPQ